MNDRMALFLFEASTTGYKLYGKRRRTGYDIGFFNPYRQWPKAPRKLAYMDRPLFEGYRTHPELSRGSSAGFAFLARSVVTAPIFMAVAVPAALAIGLSELHGDTANYPWSSRIKQERNNPTQLYLQD